MSQKYFVLNKDRDWASGFIHNLEINKDGLRIAAKETVVVEKLVSRDDLAFASEFVDVALGMNNLLYILDRALNLWIYDCSNNSSYMLFGNHMGLFTGNSMISAAGGLLFIADPFAKEGLKALSLDSGQLVWVLEKAMERKFSPIAITVDRQGNLFALIYNKDEKDGSLEILHTDASGIVRKVFGKKDLTKPENRRIELLRHQYFMKVAQDGNLYILESVPKMIKCFSMEGMLLNEVSLVGVERPYCIEADERGVLYVGDLRLKDKSELNHRNIKMLSLNGEDLGVLSSFGGKLHKLLMEKNKRLFVLNYEEHFITILKREMNYRDAGESGISTGVYISPLIDSGDNETVWHKFEMNAYIPKDTQIRVSYFSCDDIDIKTPTGIIPLKAFLDDTDIAVNEKVEAFSRLWSKPAINPFDALVLNSTGRYLCMRIEFVGSVCETPVLKALKVVYPRESYIRYLPAIYRQEENNKDFLERFLSIFETMLMDMESKIDNVSRYFDIDTADGEHAVWLAGWLGIKPDANLEETKLKELVRNAPELYKRRGTLTAIKKIVEIYTGDEPFIVEQFNLNQVENDINIKSIYEKLYGKSEYVFYVLLKPGQIKTEAERTSVENILNSQKPAHTAVVLVTMQPWIYLDGYSYLGINSCLSQPTQLRLEHGSIPHNSVLTENDKNTKLEGHFRIDTGITLS